MVSSTAGKLVGAGITLIFMGVGVLAYAETIKSAWNWGWQTFSHQSAPFGIIDPNYGVLVIVLGFALFGIAYLFR